jgi:hypothetical protein
VGARPAVMRFIRCSFNEVSGLPASSEQVYAQFGPPSDNLVVEAAFWLKLIGIRVASAASSVHQQATVAKQDPGAWLSDKRPSSFCPSCRAALRYTHSAYRLRTRPKRAHPAWLVLAVLTRLYSVGTRNLPLTLSHGQVHQWSRPCPSSYALYSVAQAPPSSPVALVPGASSSTRGWGEVVRRLPESHRAWLLRRETGGRVLLLQKGRRMEASWACDGRPN